MNLFLLKIIKNFLFIFLSLFIFIYSFNKSNNSIFDNYYFIYFIFSGLVLIFGIFFIFLKDEIKKIIIIVFCSIVFSLYLIEGFIGYQYYQNYINKVKEKKDYDIRSPFEAYMSYKKKYDDLKFRIIPKQFWKENNSELLPLSTFSNNTIFNCNENGYFSIWKSDMFGFNNLNQEWNKKNGILLLGDSFTAGECVYEKDNIAGNLRQKINDKKIINLGMGGNGPLSNYATLKEYFLKVNPKVVFWFHYEGNDFDDLKKELDNKILKKYLLNDSFTQNLIIKQNAVDNKLNKFLSKNEERISKKAYQNRFDWGRFFKLYTVREMTIHSIFRKPHKIPEEFYLIINKSKNFIEKNNSEFYFVYLPQFHRYSNYFNFQQSKNYEKTIKYLKKNKIKYIDIDKEVFQKIKDPLDLFPFKSAGHYNEKGYRLIAETIYKKLKESN